MTYNTIINGYGKSEMFKEEMQSILTEMIEKMEKWYDEAYYGNNTRHQDSEHPYEIFWERRHV